MILIVSVGQLYTSWERSMDWNVLDIDCWFCDELQRLRYCSITSSSLTPMQQWVCTKSSKEFFLLDSGGDMVLNSSHLYYYQVQAQAKLCGANFVFVAWIKKELFIERIFLHNELISDAMYKGTPFFKVAVLPEVVGKRVLNKYQYRPHLVLSHTFQHLILKRQRSCSASVDMRSQVKWFACGMCPHSTNMASTITTFIPSYFTSVLCVIALEQNMLSITVNLQLCTFLASLKCSCATFRCWEIPL